MERQLDRIEKSLAKIGEHKSMNTGSLRNEVKVSYLAVQLFTLRPIPKQMSIFIMSLQEFVIQYRLQISRLNEKGKEMFEAYHEILVSTVKSHILCTISMYTLIFLSFSFSPFLLSHTCKHTLTFSHSYFISFHCRRSLVRPQALTPRSCSTM